MRFLAAVLFGAILAAPANARQVAEACPPAGWTAASLASLKGNKFALEDRAARGSLALALTACLGDPNPALRDGVAFEALTTWLRAAQLDRATVTELRDRLLTMLASVRPPLGGVATTIPDPGFRGPFAALVMAEVARTDRITPWMTPGDREALVQAAATYVPGIQDYRAFSDKEGFRHGVAHGADFVLQLVLNPAVTKSQLDRLLAAIGTQRRLPPSWPSATTPARSSSASTPARA